MRPPYGTRKHHGSPALRCCRPEGGEGRPNRHRRDKSGEPAELKWRASRWPVDAMPNTLGAGLLSPAKEAPCVRTRRMTNRPWFPQAIEGAPLQAGGTRLLAHLPALCSHVAAAHLVELAAEALLLWVRVARPHRLLRRPLLSSGRCTGRVGRQAAIAPRVGGVSEMRSRGQGRNQTQAGN